ADLDGFRQPRVDLRTGSQAGVAAEDQVVLQLRRGRDSDSEKSRELFSCFFGSSLGNIRRDRGRCTPHLTDQPRVIPPRNCGAESMSIERERVSKPPNLESFEVLHGRPTYYVTYNLVSSLERLANQFPARPVPSPFVRYQRPTPVNSSPLFRHLKTQNAIFSSGPPRLYEEARSFIRCSSGSSPLPPDRRSPSCSTDSAARRAPRCRSPCARWRSPSCSRCSSTLPAAPPAACGRTRRSTRPPDGSPPAIPRCGGAPFEARIR